MDPLPAKVVAAAAGSTLTALTMTPFDVLKTRLQTQPPPSLFPLPPTAKCCQPPSVPCKRNMSSYARASAADEVVCLWENGTWHTERVNGIGDALRKVWRTEGIRGLWKGVGTSFMIAVPSSTVYMVTYDHLLKVVLPPLSPYPAFTPLFAGVISRTMVTSAVSPLELLRTNLQSTPISPLNPHTLRSVFTSVRSLVASRGVLSLWRGLGPTLWRDVPFSGIYWASYEALKNSLARRGHKGVEFAFLSGVISGSAAAIITSPFDVLKTRRQALLMSEHTRQMSRTFPLLAQIVRNEGASALFAGLSPRMAKIAPACGIMIACFEGLGAFLTQKG